MFIFGASQTASCFVPDHQPEPGEAGKDGITSYRCYAGYPTSKKVFQVASTTSSHHRPGPGLRAHRGHMGHFPDEIPAPGEAYECHLYGKSSRDRGPVERCARLDGCAFCSKFTIGSKEKITYVQETYDFLRIAFLRVCEFDHGQKIRLRPLPLREEGLAAAPPPQDDPPREDERMRHLELEGGLKWS